MCEVGEYWVYHPSLGMTNCTWGFFDVFADFKPVMYLVGFSVSLVYQYNLFLGRAFIDITLTGGSKSK